MTVSPRRPSPRWALIVVAGVLLAFPLLPLGSNRDSPLMRAVFDAGHFPLLAVFTAVCFTLLAGGRLARFRLGAAVALGLLAALAVELIQPWIDRTSSVRDFLIGLLGVFTTATAVWVWRRPGVGLRLLHVFVVAILAMMVLRPTWHEFEAARWRRQHFPLLADFEDSVELRLWSPRGNRLLVPSTMTPNLTRSSSGEGSLQIQTARGQYGGALYTAGRQDWQGFGSLVFDLYNPGEAFSFLLRIDDSGDCTERESRFNRDFTVETGWSSVRVALSDVREGPERRELKMSEITRVIFLARRSPTARIFYLDHVRLEE